MQGGLTFWHPCFCFCRFHPADTLTFPIAKPPDIFVMNRYFLPPTFWGGEVLSLSGDEAKHCTRVMRAAVGDHVELFDGEGKSAICKIETLSRSEVGCIAEEICKHSAVAHPITLCQSIPKGGNMELIVQKSVELGVSAIQPLITAHTVARPEALAKKQMKWQRIALEACKQCGQNYLPEVKLPRLYNDWLLARSSQPQPSLAVVAALDEQAVTMKSLFQSPLAPGSVDLLVGPEGDLSADEYQSAYDQGFQPVTLGAIVMRVETATMYSLSVLQHELAG